MAKANGINEIGVASWRQRVESVKAKGEEMAKESKWHGENSNGK